METSWRTCRDGNVIKWPQWQTLICEEQVKVDMSLVCPPDVKKMLLEQTRTAYWWKWAAKHECEELNEGARLRPIQAMPRRKDQRNMDRQAPQCDKEVGRGRRMGADKIVRLCLVG